MRRVPRRFQLDIRFGDSKFRDYPAKLSENRFFSGNQESPSFFFFVLGFFSDFSFDLASGADLSEAPALP